jgi:prepilin-type N-terminal cleavage/methylation domain-containing protein
MSRAADNQQAEGPARSRRDRGMTFVEVLVTIVLLGTVSVAVLAGLRATVIGTRIERDHSKAQQWLQSAVGVIEAKNFAKCSTLNLTGTDVRDAYQTEVDAKAARPYGFNGAMTVFVPEVWDGATFVPFASQPSLCYDEFLLRQQLVTIEVRGPDNDIIEIVEMVKRDKN